MDLTLANGSLLGDA